MTKNLRKHKLVQVRNPKTDTFVLINVTEGKILGHHPRKDTPYRNIVIKGVSK